MQKLIGTDLYDIVGTLPLPAGAVPAQASSAVVANAVASAALAAVAGKTNYVTGVLIHGLGATAAAAVAATLAGLLGGTMNFHVSVPAGATTPIGVNAQPIMITFPQPLAASAVNTAITLSVPAFGAGNTAAECSIFGFTL